jgi:CheY-like chemotaxis protein
LQPMSYVRLSVSDTGTGMSPSTLSRIFEPFYTTKAPGEGTGLGLAVVQGIMQCHEGLITVYSHPGEGTTFHLYFPAYGGAEEDQTREIASGVQGRGQRILYVDDEPILARMGKKILEHLGYAVEICSDATKALESVRANASGYELIITDQMMPTMTGMDLARQIREISSDVPIILVTGYAAKLTVERVQTLGIQDLLLKPISVEALGASVHRVLSELNTRPTHETNTAR